MSESIEKPIKKLTIFNLNAFFDFGFFISSLKSLRKEDNNYNCIVGPDVPLLSSDLFQKVDSLFDFLVYIANNICIWEILHLITYKEYY